MTYHIDTIKTIRSDLVGLHGIVGDFSQSLAALYALEQAMREPVDLIVRNCCEAEKADPDHPDTICISVQDLTAILEQHAAPVAQQPQARPDFTDEWTGYLKDGETPFERFLRERKDLDALMKLYQRVLEENEQLKAQQAQAEAVPLTHVLVPVDEPTDEMVDAACAAVDGLCRVDFVRAYVAAFAHLKAGYRDESYWCGWNAAIKFQQAESAHQYNLANRLRVHLANRHTLTGPEFKDGVAGILAEYYTAPQQAEAVPTFDEQLREVAKRAIPQQAEAVPELCPSCRNGDLYACTCTFPKTKPEPEALPIGVVVAIDASDPETGPDAIVALHRDVALGAKLYDKPPSRSAEIAELKESLRISLENYESQRKAAGQARAAMYDIHYALKDAGWHPGRTDDKLADIIRAKGERMRELEADSGIKLTPEEVEALRLTMSSAVLFSRAKNISDIRSSVLTRFDQFFEHVKDHVRPHQPDPEAVAEGLAQIIFEAINPGKVWTYQSTDLRNAYWQAGQAAKEFLK